MSPSPLTGISLTAGPLPAAVWVLTALSLAFLLWRRRPHWGRRVASAAAATLIITWGLHWYLIHRSRISAYDLPWAVQGTMAFGVFGVLLTALNMVGSRLRRKLGAALACVVVLTAATLQSNAYYGTYSSLDDLNGASTAGITPLPESLTAQGSAGVQTMSQPPDGATALVDHWTQPAGLPEHGDVYTVKIPGPRSGFPPTSGYVYLPPAYHASPRPRLPVLVLLTGQPGIPSQWLTSAKVPEILDAYAANHDGLAPIVVMPDVNASPSENLLCMDSRLAKADTYISQDLPAWIKDTLTVDTAASHWVIGGFSWGGTCALQQTALHPEVFPNAMVFSGEAEPGLSADRSETVQAAFGGDTAAFEARLPLEVMSRRTYEDSQIYFAAGADDDRFSGFMLETSSAAERAGILTEARSIPGAGHSWEVPKGALGPALTWYSSRLGLSR